MTEGLTTSTELEMSVGVETSGRTAARAGTATGAEATASAERKRADGYEQEDR